MKRDRDERRNKFKYKKRSVESAKEQANQQGGSYDKVFKNEFPVFAPKKGQKYRVRILPPTWDDANHFGFKFQQHAYVGADGGSYLCLAKHPDPEKQETCPICEESKELARQGDKDAAYKAKAKDRYVYWIIDRDHEDEGPKLWGPSWTVDRDIMALAFDEDTNEAVWIDDPNEGRDLSFKCVAKGEFSELISLKIAPRAAPISDSEKLQDKWLNFIQDNPASDCLLYQTAEHIEKALTGGKVREDEDENAEDEDEPKFKTRKESRRVRDDDDDDDEEEEDRPRKKSLRDDDDAEDDDDDERPRKKKKARHVDDDDEAGDDDAGDDEGDDDDDDERPRKRRRDTDDDDDSDDEDDSASDDDDDEEGGDDDEQVHKSAKPNKAKHSRRDKEREGNAHKSSKGRAEKGVKRRPADDDDDD